MDLKLKCTTLAALTSLVFLSNLPNTWSTSEASTPYNRMLALVKQPPIILNDHKGPLLKGNLTLHLLWYGNFTPTHRSIIINFIISLNSTYPHPHHPPPPHSVQSWWQTISSYRGGPCTLTVGNQIHDNKHSLGKSLKTTHLLALATKTVTTRGNSISVVLTDTDVVVEDFCMNQCGTHGSGRVKNKRVVYTWVGNSATQCPGECAWPFQLPVYGPPDPPLIPPNGDVGIDGMVINLATVLAGAVTNPFTNGYYEGARSAPLEAVSACTGIFGKGAYPGYAGKVLVDNKTGASYNAVGVHGRKFLLPAMWDPVTSTCKTLV